MDPLLCRKRGHSGFLWLPALPGPCRMSDRHQRSKKRWDQSVFFRSHTPLLMPQLLNPWTKVAGLDLHPSQICYEIAVECFWSFLIHPHLRKHACQLWGSWTREMLQTAEDTKHEDLYSPSRTLAFGTGSTWTVDTQNHSQFTWKVIGDFPNPPDRSR